MTRTPTGPSSSPYSDPTENQLDRAFLERVSELLVRWLQARNGGRREEMQIEIMFGLGPNKETTSIFLRASRSENHPGKPKPYCL